MERTLENYPTIELNDASVRSPGFEGDISAIRVLFLVATNVRTTCRAIYLFT